MDMGTYFIKDQTEYLSLRKLLDIIFDFSNELPDQVFRPEFNQYFFIDNAIAIGGNFWKIIQPLASATKDETIIFSVIDPDPFERFYQEFGYINCGILPISFDKYQYYGFLGYNNDQIIGGSNVAVWASPSLKWGIYGDFSLETSILAIRENADIDLDLAVDPAWGSLDDALDIWISQIFSHSNMVVPKIVEEPLRKNYSKKI